MIFESLEFAAFEKIRTTERWIRAHLFGNALIAERYSKIFVQEKMILDDA